MGPRQGRRRHRRRRNPRGLARRRIDCQSEAQPIDKAGASDWAGLLWRYQLSRRRASLTPSAEGVCYNIPPRHAVSDPGCDRRQHQPGWLRPVKFSRAFEKKLNPIRGLSAVSFIAETGRGVSTSSPRSVLACDGILVCYTVSSSAECMAGVHDRANSSTRQRIACVDEFYNPVSRGGWARQPASATQFPFRIGRASAMASPRPAIPGAPAICSDH
jgi:hypothetical protein